MRSVFILSESILTLRLIRSLRLCKNTAIYALVGETTETPGNLNVTFTDNLIRNLRHFPLQRIVNWHVYVLTSHNMSVETGRWSEVVRENRMCQTFKVIGDELHYIYNCCDIDRTNLENIPSLEKLSSYNKFHLLMERLEPCLN